MPRFTMGESKFDVPAGQYPAEFLGVEQVENEKYGAGLKWRFRITQGQYAGKETSRTTGLEPTFKSQCGKILNGLAGGVLAKDEECDTDQFVGKVFQIVVEQGDGAGTRVATVQQSVPQPVLAPPPNGGAPEKPPPAPPRAAEPLWYIEAGGAALPVPFTKVAIQKHIEENGLYAADVSLCRKGTQEWKPASSFGFVNSTKAHVQESPF